MNSNQEIVLQFINALNEEDFAVAQDYLGEGFIYKGPNEKRVGIKKFMDDIKMLLPKYDVRNIFNNGKSVCVIYDILHTDKDNVTTCGLFRVKKNKLQSLNVIVDMRPVVQPIAAAAKPPKKIKIQGS